MIKKKKWIIEINNNKIIVENQKEFTKFVALKILRKHRIIKNERYKDNGKDHDRD